MTGATTGNSFGTGINDISGTAFNVGTTTVTYHIEDAAGNFAECSFDVVVNDVQNPTFTVPDNDTICRDLDCDYLSNIDPSLTGDVTDEWDNCTMPIEATYSDDDI